MNMHAVGFRFFHAKKLILIILVFFLSTFIPSTMYAQNAQSTDLVENSFFEDITGRIRPPFPHGAVEKPTQEALSDTMLYAIIGGIAAPMAPFSYGQYLVFVHYDESENARVSIAFANEAYAQVHHFVRLKSNPRILAYVVPKKETAITLQYRLVVNGTWTHDYQNPRIIIDENSVQVSVATMDALPHLFFPSFVYNKEKKQLRFFLYLDTGETQKLTDTSLREVDTTTITPAPVYVVGNFTAWDPFLIRMKQSPERENLYYADVALDEGTYYYYFQVGNYDVLDPHNTSIVPRRTEDLYVNALVITKSIDANTGAPYLVTKKPYSN